MTFVSVNFGFIKQEASRSLPLCNCLSARLNSVGSRSEGVAVPGLRVWGVSQVAGNLGHVDGPA